MFRVLRGSPKIEASWEEGKDQKKWEGTRKDNGEG